MKYESSSRACRSSSSAAAVDVLNVNTCCKCERVLANLLAEPGAVLPYPEALELSSFQTVNLVYSKSQANIYDLIKDCVT